MSDEAALPRSQPVPAPRLHRRGARPDDHLCSCGRLRDACVRVAVRAVWSDPAPTTGRPADPAAAALAAGRSASPARAAAATVLAGRSGPADPVEDRARRGA